jgi:hypothetical protein
VAYVRAKTFKTRGGADDPHTLGRDGRLRMDHPQRYADEYRGVQRYYQLVESRRVNGQPKQRLIAHLGFYPSVDSALRYLPREIQDLRRRGCSANAIAKLQRRLEHLRRLRRQGIA